MSDYLSNVLDIKTGLLSISGRPPHHFKSKIGPIILTLENSKCCRSTEFMYKLNFFVPESHLETVKNALLAKGAGHYNAYDQCCWQVRGEGQYRPLANSRPYLGSTGQLEKMVEYKVEMICTDATIKDVVETLLCVHPYQEPAYEIYKILTVEDF